MLCMKPKHIVLKDERGTTLLEEARLQFLRENSGVRATDEAVVLVALEKYLVGDSVE